MGKRVKGHGSKAQETSGKDIVKAQGARGGNVIHNDSTAKVNRCTRSMSAAAAKSVSKSRDILKDVNTADVIEKDTPKVPVHVKLNKTKKRKERFEDCQSRKKQKKDDVRAANCTPGKGSDFLSSNKVVKDGSEAAADVELKTMSGLQTLKKGQKLSDELSNSKEKDASTKKPETKNCTSPGKSKVNKLKQKISKLNKPEDKEASLEKKKSPLKRKQHDGKSSNTCTELSIKQLVLKNKDDCKDVKKNGKGKSPMKKTLKGRSSYPTPKTILDSEISADDGDESDMEWEDVAEADVGAEGNGSDEGDSNLPSTSSNVEVTIKVPGKRKRSGKCSQEEIRQWIQRRINRIRKESQICAHKVHLLSLLAVGLRKNDLCNNSIVQGVALSLVPDSFTQRRVPKTWDITFLSRVATWFKNKAPAPADIHTSHSEGTYLMRVLEKKVYLFVAVLRALGLSVRLVMSLQALNIKVSDVNGGKNLGASRTSKDRKGKEKSPKDGQRKPTSKKEAKKNSKENSLSKVGGKSTPRKFGVRHSDEGGKGDIMQQTSTGRTESSRTTLRKKPRIDYSIKEKIEESEYFQEAKKSSGESSSTILFGDSDDESDFEITTPKSKKSKTAGTSSKKLDRPSVEGEEHSLDHGESSKIRKRGVDVWVEVYLEKEKKWMCIDAELYSVNQPHECEKLATKPIKYVVAFDNESSIKDVTCRYASGWLTSTPKLRVDPEWWNETLSFYKTKHLKRDKKEDSLMKASLLRKPLPTTVTEYKNHPLYALKRHLLKFEAIYPESAATLGFCRGEPVYSRDCVHTLHTRELWMKEARVVKSGEQPYKIVKGRKSRRKLLENVGEITAELFGKWQTEDYVPPPVIDGKIPRNEYGNVELFKPSMLPPGTCHIRVPGIHRLARKLSIDAVPAVVGFDFHCGFSHPVIDGVVVCEEHKDVLLDAWDKEQEQRIKREQEKREKRAIDNWTHLVRSLRIRERLKRKYNMEDEDKVEEKNQCNETEDVTDISLSWPLNKQEGKSTRADNGHCHVFLEANHYQDPITGEWTKTCSCGHKEPL